MLKRPLASLCLAVAVLLLAPVASALACDGAGASPNAPRAVYTHAVRCLINEQRAAIGLGALRPDRRLAVAASRYSDEMVRDGFFSHVSPSGSTFVQRARAAGVRGSTLGETIAWGQGELATPASIVASWMASPPHRGILLGRMFHRIGLGIASGSPEHLAEAATVTADVGG